MANPYFQWQAQRHLWLQDKTLSIETKIGFAITPLMPTHGGALFTAFNAYSICTNLPDGLQKLFVGKVNDFKTEHA
jgi:hypothetical protein